MRISRTVHSDTNETFSGNRNIKISEEFSRRNNWFKYCSY